MSGIAVFGGANMDILGMPAGELRLRDSNVGRVILRPGGVLLSDNVLKEGEILESKFVLTRRNRTIHKRMREYLTAISRDPRLRTVLMETGDGAALSVKRRI